MNDMLSLVLNSIKLDSYGSSRGFVGCFEKAGKYKPGMAEAAVDLFCEFYAESLQDAVVVSSLHINSDEVGHCGDSFENDRDLSLVQSPVSSGAIRVLSYDEEFGHDYESEEYESAIEAVWNDLKVSRVRDYAPTIFRSLLVARLLVYGIHGHCFLVFEKLGLACYPSDDIGFGVIALREDADIPAAHEFLRKGGALEAFRSVIER